MKILLLLISLLPGFVANAQALAQGRVTDQETGKPLSGVSVFLSNTSIGTVSAEDGSFELLLPQGRFDVIFTFVGYQTKVVSSTDTTRLRQVKMQPIARELEEVEIHSFEKDGWAKWGLFFTEHFLGTTKQAEDCSLEGTKFIRFRHDKKGEKLIAFSNEPLVIVNRSLGYRIRYLLEQFVYDFHRKTLYFEGFPFFEEMTGGKGRQSTWTRNRLAAYRGSQMHFMRALYRNRLEEEGFEVHRLQKVRNYEKERVRSIFRNGAAADSGRYYETVLSQPDEYDLMSLEKLSGDSIAYAVDSVTAGLSFSDYLHIQYTRSRPPAKYYRMHPGVGKGMISQITLQGPGITIQSNGSFSPPQHLLMLGYWSWSEKISTLLPLDYRAP